jgi:hypothetical protein
VASDGSLQSAVHTVSIIINPVNHPPVAQNLSLQSDSQGVIGAVSATDVDGNALTYAKVTSPAHGTLTFNGDGSFVYMPATGYAGADSFTFVANDGTVNSAPATVSIQVVAPNPAPVAYDLALVSTNHSAAGNVLGSDSNGAPLTFRVLTQPGHGTVAFSADGSFLYTGNPAWALADSFTFCANDGQTDSAAATVTINPGTDQPPTAAAASFQTNQDVPVAGALTGTDPNGSSLSFSLVLMPSHGAASLGADGSFVYTPNSRWYGLDSFTFRVNDGTADSQPATVGIRVARVNHKPGKIDRTIRASATQPTVSSTLVATSIDNTPLTYSAVSQPDYGTVQVQPDGSFTYTPNAPGVLTDSFTYVASNGVLTSDVATVTIQLGNRLGFDGHSKVSFVDANGGTVTVSLIGPGGGYILFDQAGNCDPSSIVLNGTTAKSSVIVSLRGQMNVGEIDINGALGAFTAAAANLTGDLTASGTIGKLTLADVSGSQMTIGAGDATASSTITLNNVVDSSLTSGTAIKSLSVIGWSGTGNTTETLTAPALVSLTTRGGKNVSGDWDANLTLTGQQQPQPILGTVRIAGDVDGSIWDVAGTVGSVLVSGNVTQWSLDASTITSMMVSGNAQSLTMDLGTADLRLLRLGNSLGVGITAGHVGTIIATQWVGGFLHGDTLTAMNITQNLDADLSIANSQSAAAPVGAITVGGDITGGQWNLVGSARSVSAGNIDNLNLTAGRLGTMTARGDLAGSRLVFTQGVGPAAALSRLTVNGNLSGSTILSAGNIGAVTAGTLTNSAILLGLRPDYATDANGDGVLDLPTAGDFVSNAQLSSLTVRGGQGASSFTNSNVAAGQIGRVSLRDVNLANAQQAFGFTANQSINSIQWTQGRSRYTWEQNVWPADTGDLVVQIV